MAGKTKERILDASGELFRRQGYMGTGVKEILAEAVRRSGALYGLLLGEFAGPEVELAAGIRAFFAGAAETLVETDYADACPIATVALETASTDEELRQACADVFNAWI